MDKDHLAMALPHSWVSCLCRQLPFPCLRAAVGAFPASEVLLEMMQQRLGGAKCLVSLPARQVAALCTQRRGCLGRCWSLGTTPLLGYGVAEKKPWRLGQELATGAPLNTPALWGNGRKLVSHRRAGTEILLHLICRGGFGWIFHLV